LAETHARLTRAALSLGSDYEVLYVDDGSRDGTLFVLRGIQRSDPRVRVVALSRNFGHQVAISAGLDAARGDAVVVIDADLQDPPELIPELVARWREGNEVVYGSRTARRGESAARLWITDFYYRTLGRLSDVVIPEEAGDFRLLDRRVVDVLKAMPERDRYLRGMVSWIGFRQLPVPYVRDARAAGKGHYSLARLARLGIDGLTSFSSAPIRGVTWLGVALGGLSATGILLLLALHFFSAVRFGPWTVAALGMTFLAGVQLVALGLVGEYVAQIYREVKRRPTYVVAERLGFDAPPP
ncbi:MAG: glycosyltransferase family 2 protein, partial [Acidobacteriota bacterium]